MNQQNMLLQIEKIEKLLEDLRSEIESTTGIAHENLRNLSAPASGFKFSNHSKAELQGVNDTLVAVTYRALALTTQDFIVFDGMRTEAEQRKLVAKGASQTMDSKHLTGDAVDLVPWINGKPDWDWGGCYRIAWAMHQAAKHYGVLNRIRWGGCWDKTFHEYNMPMSAESMYIESQLYVARRRDKGASAFLDGVHYELVG